ALDGVISVLQSGQVGAQVGVGMSIQPGELLDPVNDLVEQFSDVMLAVTVALGVHKVLLSIGGYWVLPILLSALAVLLVVVGLRGGAPRWLTQAFVLLLLVRFAVPVATVGADALFARFLASEYESSQQVLDAIEGRSAEAAGAQAPADEGWVASFRRMLSAGDGLRERAAAIADAADRIAEHVSNLIVVFVLQTIASPVVLLWLLWQLARRRGEPPRASAQCAPPVLHCSIRPDWAPARNQRTRCSELPWVNASGTTTPWVRFMMLSSPTAAAAFMASSMSPASSQPFACWEWLVQMPAKQSAWSSRR